MNVLLGVTGGIAAYKSAYLASLLKKDRNDINVVMTKAATEFVAPLTFETLSNNPVSVDMFADKKTWEVEHIALAQKAEVAILAPASASTIAKLACGIADNMLTTVFLALRCPVVIVPAMNDAMYENIATQVNLQILKDRGYYIMQPGEGLLACGDVGKGRMREPEEIYDFLRDVMKERNILKGKKVLITAGPTREMIDPVRYISNRSSGKMGYALAECAKRMGAEVTLISGPVSISAGAGIDMIPVVSAKDMYDAVMHEKETADVVIACAAVADYTPLEVSDKKLIKTESLNIEMVKTKDILAELGMKKSCYLVGFAAQTHDLELYAESKLQTKNLDMIVANDVSDETIGFDSVENQVTIMRKDGSKIQTNREKKGRIAEIILEEIAKDIQ